MLKTMSSRNIKLILKKMKAYKSLLLFVLPFVVLNSCQLVNEVHYFRSGDNYYRLTVRARAFASKSRYLAGYFDENAVDNYFSELTKKDTVNYFYKAANEKGGKDSKSLEINPNSKLVMILSTNSDAVSDQIGNLAQNDQTLEILARLANKDKINENNDLNTKITSVLSENKAILSTGDLFINSIEYHDLKSQNVILNYMNFISAIKKLNFNFNSVNDAYEWLGKNK